MEEKRKETCNHTTIAAPFGCKIASSPFFPPFLGNHVCRLFEDGKRELVIVFNMTVLTFSATAKELGE